MNDLISRQAVIESIQECADAAHRNHEWDMEQGYRNAIECVEEAPSAQPECEDAVSRESVLDEIHRYMEERDYTIGLLHDNVCGLPPVTPKQPGWIPVTERLPERYDNYLITTEDEDTDIGTFHPEFKQWSICDADGFRLTDGVLAWCELPKPWEGEQDEEKAVR